MQWPSRSKSKSQIVAATLGTLMVVAVAIAVLMLNSIGCTLYGRWAGEQASDEPPPRLARPARLIEGSLCHQQGTCEPAVLVQGLLSIETVAMIRDRAHEAGSQTLVLCLHSIGGSGDVSMEAPLPPNVRTCVAQLQQQQGAEVFPSLCESACAWLWMGGRERALYGAARVGFHRPYVLDAPMCTPANWFNAAVSYVRSWATDRMEPAFSAEEFAARQVVRRQALEKGPRETHTLDAAEAVRLRLLARQEPPATFRPDAPARRPLPATIL